MIDTRGIRWKFQHEYIYMLSVQCSKQKDKEMKNTLIKWRIYRFEDVHWLVLHVDFVFRCAARCQDKTRRKAKSKFLLRGIYHSCAVIIYYYVYRLYIYSYIDINMNIKKNYFRVHAHVRWMRVRRPELHFDVIIIHEPSLFIIIIITHHEVPCQSTVSRIYAFE